MVITTFGALIRLSPALSASFPLFDGGLFYAMAQDLQASHMTLPYYVSYNGGQIPFIYPPLGHFVLVIFSEVTQTPLITMMRLLPPFISILTIPAFYFLARSILNEKGTAFISACAFAVLPPAFDWLIMGGSITRTPGFLFALLTLDQVIHLFRYCRKENLALTVVFASLTIYSHPAMAWFVFYSSILFFLFTMPNIKKLGLSLMVAVFVILLTAPWWFTLVTRFTFQPLVNALKVGTGSISSWTFSLPLLFLFTNEPLLDLQAVLGLLGVMIAVQERKFILVAWFLLIFVVQTSESAIVASIPFALFVGLSICHLILPGLSRSKTDEIDEFHWRPTVSQMLFLVYVIVIGLFSAYSVAGSMKAIPQGDIEAMTWIKENTPLNSRFLVIVGEGSVDPNVSEWFPALTNRISVNTREGMEWSTFEIGKTDPATFARLQSCALQTLSCIEKWSLSSENQWDHLYITVNAATMADGSASTLFESLQSSPSYELIFSSESDYIFHRLFY